MRTAGAFSFTTCEPRASNTSGRGHFLAAGATREVICCAGAIGSPHLLLASGIGPGAHLRSHAIPVVAGSARSRRESAGSLDRRESSSPARRRFRSRRPESVKAVLQYLTAHRGLLSSNIAEGYGFVRSSSDLHLADLELLFVPGPFLDEGLTLSAMRNGPSAPSFCNRKAEDRSASMTPILTPIRSSILAIFRTPADEMPPCSLKGSVSPWNLAFPPLSQLVGDALQPQEIDDDKLIERSVQSPASLRPCTTRSEPVVWVATTTPSSTQRSGSAA